MLGCSRSAVNVIKLPPAITNQTLKDPTSSLKVIDAHTHWFFHCQCQLSYDLERNSSDHGTEKVTLKITAVEVKLSLPITICLPPNPDARLITHENGHVRICTDIYDHADEIASRLSQQVVGKSFEGSGATLDAACRQAVEHALQTITSGYREETVTKAQRISNIFDELQSTNQNTVDGDLLQARNQYHERQEKEKAQPAKVTL
jgi:hypothetical protein